MHPTGSAMAEDDYERAYMSQGEVLYRHRAMPSRTFHLVMLAALLLPLLIMSIVAMAPAVSPLMLLCAIPSMLVTAAMWLLFSVLRVAVTKDQVHVQYGLFGPTIPLRAISSCEAVSYDWKKYGGFGIRRARDGSMAYNLMGDGGRAVRLAWTDPRGKEQVTLLSATDPDTFVAAVQRARAATGTGARVSAPKPPVADDPAVLEAERELEAELEAERTGSCRARSPGRRG